MKILSADQARKVDAFTVANEPVSSLDLMERAAVCCLRKLTGLLPREESIFIVCGKGNNGGDGMAIARLLHERGFQVKLVVVHHASEFSSDAEANYIAFRTKFPSKLVDVHTKEELISRVNDKGLVIIDALFGSGLNRPVDGLAAEVIDHMNVIAGKIISIDMPSGLFADTTSLGNKHIARASVVLTFQFPKLAFLMPENKEYSAGFEVLEISLHADAIANQPVVNYYVTSADIKALVKKRNKFDHKGTFGHALLAAGSKGKAGSALISARACLRSGAGLLTVHSVKDVISALTHALPEAMSYTDDSAGHLSALPSFENYDAIGIGPGIGLEEATQKVLKQLIQNYRGRLVIDADGLNILSENKTWLAFLPPFTILTPHVKEFERLAGKSENDFARLEMLREFSVKHSCVVILKGAYSAIAMPDGTVFFNSTGNPGLAKGGSGDALTGIILGLLSRGYNPPQAALIGTYVHGLAADTCSKKMSMESMLISDVIERLPKAFKKLEG